MKLSLLDPSDLDYLAVHFDPFWRVFSDSMQDDQFSERVFGLYEFCSVGMCKFLLCRIVFLAPRGGRDKSVQVFTYRPHLANAAHQSCAYARGD